MSKHAARQRPTSVLTYYLSALYAMPLLRGNGISSPAMGHTVISDKPNFMQVFDSLHVTQL